MDKMDKKEKQKERLIKFLNKGEHNLHSTHSLSIFLKLGIYRVSELVDELISERKAIKYKRGGRLLIRLKRESDLNE